MVSIPDGSSFRLGYVPGVTPAKWAKIWRERRPDLPLELVAVDVCDSAAAVGEHRVDIVLTRFPDALAHTDPGPHHTITLYTETTVVVVPKGHLLTAVDELALADVADEQFLWPADDPLPTFRPGAAVKHRPATTGDAVELVAAGAGLLAVPQSLARLHHRRDLAYRPLTGAPGSTVGLLWTDPTSPSADEFIGIVRGRSATSSRSESEPAAKRNAKQKLAAKRAARAASGNTPGGASGQRRRRR